MTKHRKNGYGSYGLRVTGYELRVASYELRVRKYGLWFVVCGCGLWFGVWGLGFGVCELRCYGLLRLSEDSWERVWPARIDRDGVMSHIGLVALSRVVRVESG